MANPSFSLLDVDALAVCDLVGSWRRESRRDAAGRRDVTTQVTWVQGPSTYVTLHRPSGRRPFVGIRSVRDLSHDQVRWLAGQYACAGHLVSRDGLFVRTRALDLQPAIHPPEAATLELSGNMLVETGAHDAYLEHWCYQPVGAGPTWSRTLLNPATGERAVLVRVGTIFAWARDRRPPLPAGSFLVDLVEGAGSLWAAQDFVDFEVSIGEVVDGDWIIVHSTLPYREGARLSVDLPAWTITHAERG